MFVCDPSNINACLNCPYPDCTYNYSNGVIATKKPVKDELDEELKLLTPRQLQNKKWNNSYKGKEAKKRYRQNNPTRIRENGRKNFHTYWERKLDSVYEYCKKYYEEYGEVPKYEDIAIYFNVGASKIKTAMYQLIEQGKLKVVPNE